MDGSRTRCIGAVGSTTKRKVPLPSYGIKPNGSMACHSGSWLHPTEFCFGSLDVPDEDHEDVVEMLKSCVNRIAYNHPKAGAIRWLDDVVLKPKLVELRPKNAWRL
jgi:hypothetical protein